MVLPLMGALGVRFPRFCAKHSLPSINVNMIQCSQAFVLRVSCGAGGVITF